MKSNPRILGRNGILNESIFVPCGFDRSMIVNARAGGTPLNGEFQSINRNWMASDKLLPGLSGLRSAAK
jgi:hypothetical protein